MPQEVAHKLKWQRDWWLWEQQKGVFASRFCRAEEYAIPQRLKYIFPYAAHTDRHTEDSNTVTHTHTHKFRNNLPCVSTSIQNHLQHPKIHPWELMGTKITSEKVWLNACMYPCVFVLCAPTPHSLNELHAILKDAKLVCEWGHAWSTIGGWPTKGTRGNKWTGHAIAT